MNKTRPSVGVGVIIENALGEILVGKRKGSHSPYYSIPGGHLEMGETFEEAAKKEVFEETGIKVNTSRIISITNNLETYREEGIHHVSVILHTKDYSGIPKVIEKDKCEKWIWVRPNNLPTPHFEPSRLGIRCFLEKKIYIAQTV
jgi:ADP-ribose pyrophosphatase YjhB (NUDIX family)